MSKRALEDLAIFGGESDFGETLHVGRPNIGNRKRLVEYINDILDRHWLTNKGHYVREFEQKIAEGVSNCEIWDFGYFAFDHSSEAIGYYEYAEFVLSMRGHGQILPICFNTPVISLQNHPKHMG